MVNLLESEMEDVLVNAVNAIRVLCQDNPENQTEVARNGKSYFIYFILLGKGRKSLLLAIIMLFNNPENNQKSWSKVKVTMVKVKVKFKGHGRRSRVICQG